MTIYQRLGYLAIAAGTVWCCCTSSAQVVVLNPVVVVNPVVDQAYLVTEPDKFAKVADLEEVFSGKDHLYGVSLSPEGIAEAVLKDNAEVDLLTDATAFGTVTLTVTAQDAGGAVASDTFKVTLRSNVMYVDADSPAALEDQDGARWESAYQNLQDALGEVVEDQEIWVAEGVYYPDVDAAGDSGDRSRSFRMVKKVSVYGGFAGGEATREERAPRVNLSILSGDIEQDDSQRPIATHTRAQLGDHNNSYRVVDLSDCDNKDTLDGLVITAGRADFAPDHLNGAGVYSRKDVFLENCWITGNHAAGNGGGLYFFERNAVITNCRVNGNVAGGSGGGVYARKDDPTFYNCEFRGNAAAEGGAICMEDPELELVSCLLSGNCASGSGGAIRVFNGKLLLVNSTLSANYSVGPGGAVNLGSTGDEAKFKNVILWANEGSGSTAGPAASVYVANAKPPKVYHSLVANSGGSAAWNGTAGIDEDGNMDVDPRFVMGASPHATPSESGYFLLRSDSPLLEMGLQKHLLKDQPDLDVDSNRKEKVSIDLRGGARVVGTEVDPGAYEFDPALLLDTDGDGLSDEFELMYAGDPVVMPALSDDDADRNTALGEFLHGSVPTEAAHVPVTCLGTTQELGVSYLTLSFDVDPEALRFVGYTVERRADSSWDLGWREDETAEISLEPSPNNPHLMRVTHRSLVPTGEERCEFLRVKHVAIGAGGPSLNTGGDGLLSGVNNWQW